MRFKKTATVLFLIIAIAAAAGFIIMSYLLVIDSNRDATYIKSAKVFIKQTKSLVKGHAEFIRSSVVEDLAAYKIEME